MEIIKPGTQIDFLGKRKITVVVSAFLILVSVAATSLGFNTGIDFAGGTEVQVHFSHDVDIAEVREALSQLSLGDLQVKNFGGAGQISQDYLINVEARDEEGDNEAQARVSESIIGTLSEKFNEDKETLSQRVGFVGPRAGSELRNKGTLAILITMGGILLYIAFRFESIYGVGAVVAVFHDVIITLGAFLITGREFNLTTIAAILTIVGYSLNDTIIVFDRIRENIEKYKGKSFPEVVNISLNDTLSRTILTSATTLIVVLALFLLGGGQVHDFAFALIVGIVIGTYSSIFVASSFVIYWLGRDTPEPKRKKAKAAA